ncbi:MAG: NGG1p interacting factor NIF3 [Candidatus Eisenbacteria bacterium]|nr:NGG1p interacting factor NIF3 [Candidatus Eisenbacteria bacterium]
MKLQKLYEAAVQHGISVDPRGKKRVLQELAAAKKAYGELRKEEKARFDTERLTNPYSDSRILWGDGGAEVKAVLVGIDIEVGEALLADRLIAKGRRIDALWAHHPEGAALANLGGVMAMQADILSSFGVPITAAEGLMEPRIREVERLVMPTNHMRAVDAARLLDIPLFCTHTPADNCVADHLQKLFDRRKPDTVGDVVGLLREIPEYRDAEPAGMGLKVFSGSAKRRAGRVFVDMTGGTSGSEKTLERIANTSDIGTIVAMHIPEKHREEAEKHHINVVIAGHAASDTLGMNLLIDGVEKATGSTLTVIECSGFKRYRHGRR